MDQLKMQEMTFREYEDLPEDAVRIRTEVFIEEQGFSSEFDKIDRKAAVHLVLYEKGIPAGVCRIFPAMASESETGTESESERSAEPTAGCGDIWIIGRLAVRKSYRVKGCGSSLMRRAEEAVMERGGRKIVLHAQVHAASFYEKLGYRRAGEVSEIAGCPHVRMEKVPG